MQIRYIRDWCGGSTVNAPAIWSEISAYDYLGINKALGAAVTMSGPPTYYGGTNSTSLVTDGDNTGAKYVYSTADTYIQVDLGSVTEIAYIKVWHYWADGRTFYNTYTQVSTDGTNWITVRDYRVDGTYTETSAGKLMPLWQTPYTTWNVAPGVWNYDVNRWEGNLQWLKKAQHIDLVDSSGAFTVDNVEAALNQLKTAVGPKNVGFVADFNTNPYVMSNTTQVSVGSSVLRVTSTSIDPMLTMSGLGSFNPHLYRYIEVRYKYVSGTGPTGIEIFFFNTTYTTANSSAQVNSSSLVLDGNWQVAVIDMWSHAGWKTGGNITGWRFDWATASGITLDIDYIRLLTNGGY